MLSLPLSFPRELQAAARRIGKEIRRNVFGWRWKVWCWWVVKKNKKNKSHEIPCSVKVCVFVRDLLRRVEPKSIVPSITGKKENDDRATSVSFFFSGWFPFPFWVANLTRSV